MSMLQRSERRARSLEPTPVVNHDGRRRGETLAKALGWFSIGLGAASLLAPRTFSRATGMRRPHPIGTSLFGAREIATGIGLLQMRKPVEFMAGRVAGDALDIAALGAALLSHRNSRQRLAIATAAVVGVTLLDIYATQKLGQRTHLSRQPTSRGIRVQRTMTINCTPHEAYSTWRNLENLPKFMHYLQSVTTTDNGRSHWVVKGPAGMSVSWDAELIDDRPGELIRWRSLPGSQVDTHGSVSFSEVSNSRGTEVRVVLTYDPPAGQVRASIARLFGRSGEQEVREDLRRFKRFVETGEIPTTQGQPRGACL